VKGTTKPRRRAHVRRTGKRPNATANLREIKAPKIFSDPIFSHHFASGLLRYLELMFPVEMDIQRNLNAGLHSGVVDAEFLNPPELNEKERS
jgi:hypothetical protein